MFDKPKNYFKDKCERIKELITNNKAIVAIIVLLLFALAVLIAVTAASSDENRLIYTEKEDGTLEVAGIKNTYKDGWFCRDRLTVPEQVDGKRVTSVARLDSAKLQTIILPNSVTEIGAGAFERCTSLCEIALGNSLQTIGDGAWKDCRSLRKIALPQTVQTVGTGVFEGAPIEYNVFEGLRYVGNEANPYLVLIGADGACPETIHVHEDAKIAVYATFETDDAVRIANADTANLANLPDRMFAGCKNLQSADVSAATRIGANCFENCESLREIGLHGASTVGTGAFSGCSDLERVAFGSKTEEVGDGAFSGCKELKEVHVGDLAAWCKIRFGAHDSNPLALAHRLFVGDEEISELKIPEGVTSIAEGAFMFCSGLKSVRIPDSVTVMEENAFLGCGGLKEVHVGDLAAWCKVRFGAHDANPLELAHRLFVGDEEISELKIPEGVTAIGNHAFCGFDKLVSVNIPKSVISVGVSAFEDCGALEYITVDAENRNFISKDGILYRKGLQEDSVTGFILIPKAIKGAVTIPKGINSIERGAFSGRDGLKEVHFEEPSGWRISKNSDMSFAGTLLGLDDSAQAAEFLTDIYNDFYWKQEV